MKQIILLLLFVAFSVMSLCAKGKEGHKKDMTDIYPFERADLRIQQFYDDVCTFLDSPNGDGMVSKPRFVTMDERLCRMTFANHRIWYHWGFNRNDPNKLKQFKPLADIVASNIQSGKLAASDEPYFWSCLLADIRRRNRDLMNKSAKLFGYDEIGSISSRQREQLNAFVTILYCIHILGDYTTSEKGVLEPLQDVYSDIENAITDLAGSEQTNRQKAKKINSILIKNHVDDTERYMYVLKQHFAIYILSLEGPLYNYREKFKNMGYILKNIEIDEEQSVWSIIFGK